jgi:hypothetical protein
MRVPFTSAPACFHRSIARLVAELDADFLQDGVGVVFDDLQPLRSAPVDGILRAMNGFCTSFRLIAEMPGAARATSAADAATLLSLIPGWP